MSAIILSLLFGIVAFSALFVIAGCALRGCAQGRAILSRLAELDADASAAKARRATGPMSRPRRRQFAPARRPALAAA